MLDKRELRQDELEKVSGGRRGELTAYSVVYITDGTSRIRYEAQEDRQGNITRVAVNAGYHFLGWYKSVYGAIPDGQAWCNQNNKQYHSVTEGEHNS